MEARLDFHMADWGCPFVDRRKALPLTKEAVASLADADQVKAIAREGKAAWKKDIVTLPVWQNLEAVVYGTRLLGNGEYWVPVEYGIKSLRELKGFDFGLVGDPMVEAALRAASFYKKERVIFEVQAPFSVLAALMDPMDLYGSLAKGDGLILDILYRIADAQAQYIKEAVQAGVRVISIADPVGTVNFVGEDAFTKFCGAAEHALLQKCRPYLTHAVGHICKNMAQSLAMAKLISVKTWMPKKGISDFWDVLWDMAEDDNVSFTGMTCIHGDYQELEKVYAIEVACHGSAP